jgi:hypothetical protein
VSRDTALWNVVGGTEEVWAFAFERVFTSREAPVLMGLPRPR